MMADHDPTPAPRLQVLIDEIKDLYTRGQRAYDEMNLVILEIGRRLLHARDVIPHGQWLPWLREHFDWSEQTARNYMHAASGVGRRKLEGLAIEPSALYALTAPSADPEALDAAIRQARRGATITYPEARDLVRQHRRKSTTVKDLTPEHRPEPAPMAELDTPLEETIPPVTPAPKFFDDMPVEDFEWPPRAREPQEARRYDLGTHAEGRIWRLYTAAQNFLDYEEELIDAMDTPTAASETVWDEAQRDDLRADLLALRTHLEAQGFPFAPEEDPDATAPGDPFR